jgi:hypothetical protein
MASKKPPAEDRIRQFFEAFLSTHRAHFEQLRYSYDTNGQFPEGVNRFDHDPSEERHQWQPNSQLYWQWRRALEDFAGKMRAEKSPLDIYASLTALERRAGMGMHRAADWIRSQDFPKYYQDWCNAR